MADLRDQLTALLVLDAVLDDWAIPGACRPLPTGRSTSSCGRQDEGMTPEQHRARSAAVAAEAEEFYEFKLKGLAVSSGAYSQQVARFNGLAVLAHTHALLAAGPTSPPPGPSHIPTNERLDMSGDDGSYPGS